MLPRPALPYAPLTLVQSVTSAVAMSVAYGYEITSSEDPFIEMAEEAMAMLSNATSPGAILVNALPILQYLPAWFPGAGFKRFANKCRGLTDQMRDGTFEAVKKKMVRSFPLGIISLTFQPPLRRMEVQRRVL